MHNLGFFLSDTPTTDIYTLSLHDALPISEGPGVARAVPARQPRHVLPGPGRELRRDEARLPRDRGLRGLDREDRKSTRLNSSHTVISYAVFCLKKKIRPKPVRHQLLDPGR